MPLMDVLFELEQGKRGWTETWHTDVGSPSSGGPDAYDYAAVFGANLWTYRSNLTSNQITFRGMRVSDPTVFRDSRFFVPNTTYAIPVPGALPFNLPGRGQWVPSTVSPGLPGGGATESPIGLLLRLEAGPLTRASHTLRGVPEDIVLDGSYAPNSVPAAAGNWPTKLSNFATFLTTAGPLLGSGTWRVWGVDTDPTHHSTIPITTNPLPDTLIPTVSGKGLIVSTVVTIKVWKSVGGAAPALVDAAAGDQLKINRVRGSHNVNGVWTIAVVIPPPGLATAYRLRERTALIALPHPILDGGTVSGYSKAVYDIDRVAAEQLASRDTGRPSGTPRGRTRRT